MPHSSCCLFRIPHLPTPSFPALKIHLSSETKAVLEEFDGFELELRGDVEMKVGEETPVLAPPGAAGGGAPTTPT